MNRRKFIVGLIFAAASAPRMIEALSTPYSIHRDVSRILSQLVPDVYPLDDALRYGVGVTRFRFDVVNHEVVLKKIPPEDLTTHQG